MRMKIIGTIIIALMISLAACTPTRNNTTVRQQPKVIVVNKPRPNKKVIVVNTNRNRFGNNRGRGGRGGRVIIIR